MENINHYQAFCDWLSISYPRAVSPLSDVLALLQPLCSIDDFEESPRGRDKVLYQFGSLGTLFVTVEDTYHNLSFSGSLLASIRQSNIEREFILSLSSGPYNITRLDAAYDVPIAGGFVISQLQRRFPSGTVKLAKRERKLRYDLSDFSGSRTGTVYFQDKRYQGNVKLRIYDKALQLLEVHDQVIPATTRYELTVGRGATLNDFVDPTSLFWHYMPSEVLQRPTGLLVKPWKPSGRVSYDNPLYEYLPPTDYETLRTLIQNSIALQHLVGKCLRVNGGDKLLLREIGKLLHTESRSDWSESSRGDTERPSG